MKKKIEHKHRDTQKSNLDLVFFSFGIGFVANFLLALVFSLIMTLIRFNECAGTCGFHWFEWVEGWREGFYFMCLVTTPVAGIGTMIIAGLTLKMKVKYALLSMVPIFVVATVLAAVIHLFLAFVTTLLMAGLLQIIPDAPYIPS
jgi:hypothetical protein